MSSRRLFQWPGVPALAMVMGVMATGCDGCSLADINSSEPPADAEALVGQWSIVDYAVDEDGCRPRAARAPFAHFEISLVDDSDGSGEQRLQMRTCPSDDTCAERSFPENELLWDGGLEQASVTHYTANLHHADPVDTTCRLTTEHTLLVPDGDDLELTRSHYEIDLPIEGDEACIAELAEEYHAHMPCVRGQAFRLTRSEARPDA